MYLKDDGKRTSERRCLRDMDRRICFVVPVSGAYVRMARALGNSVRHFHPGSHVVVATSGPSSSDPITALISDGPFDELISFPVMDVKDEGYSSVIWTKLQVIGRELAEFLVILDADLMMYDRIDSLVREFEESGQLLAATLDDDPFLGAAFKRDGHRRRSATGVRALSACLIIVRPSSTVAESVLALAREMDGETRWPEQAVLSAFAAENGGWCELGRRSVIQCRDEAVLRDPLDAVFLHVGSPRPEVFGASPRRWGEPSFAEAERAFLERWGAPFPAAKLSRDFELRVSDVWIASV